MSSQINVLITHNYTCFCCSCSATIEFQVYVRIFVFVLYAETTLLPITRFNQNAHALFYIQIMITTSASHCKLHGSNNLYIIYFAYIKTMISSLCLSTFRCSNKYRLKQTFERINYLK